MRSLYRSRTLAEIELLSGHFGEIDFDEVNLSYVHIMRFDLPSGFNRSYSDLVIVLNSFYPQMPPQDFFLSRGLLKYGRTPGHYFKEMGDKKYLRQGFAWYCLHILEWRSGGSIATGDNLLTAANTVYANLAK
jgi:hypothetical protein